jgi:galactose mutarotase-like enzyme
MKEKMGPREGPPGVKIETVKMRGDEVSYSPERGGIITSIKFHGKEILYLDDATVQDKSGNVRGGIPILFPNAGPVQSSKFQNLAQHGFARNVVWQKKNVSRGFSEILKSDINTRAVFPYDFILGVDGHFLLDGSFSMTQSAANNGDVEMPISMGLHPYFKVPDSKKKNIQFIFEGGDLVEKNIDKWANGEAFSIDNPKIADEFAVMDVYIPTLGMLSIDASPEYEKIYIWSMPGKDFVCIEPVMRDFGGIADNPEKVQPGSVFRAEVNIKLRNIKLKNKSK